MGWPGGGRPAGPRPALNAPQHWLVLPPRRRMPAWACVLRLAAQVVCTARSRTPPCLWPLRLGENPVICLGFPKQSAGSQNRRHVRAVQAVRSVFARFACAYTLSCFLRSLRCPQWLPLRYLGISSQCSQQPPAEGGPRNPRPPELQQAKAQAGFVFISSPRPSLFFGSGV
jgi:hypothetical protein